ncbi:MAG: hypothetical protein KGI38_10110, partial [Thaumarchaeota archaeon]|nr:hypothetical protein [Nitrososphaerota archaeon]
MDVASPWGSGLKNHGMKPVMLCIAFIAPPPGMKVAVIVRPYKTRRNAAHDCTLFLTLYSIVSR